MSCMVSRSNNPRNLLRSIPPSAKHLQSFICCHCNTKVRHSPIMGTKHRNHSPNCLFSLHVDSAVSGDRLSPCGEKMEPIGITLRYKGIDKYTGKPKYGDIMIIHACRACQTIRVNRIAADDSPRRILSVLEASRHLSEQVKNSLLKQGIHPLSHQEKHRIKSYILGNEQA